MTTFESYLTNVEEGAMGLGNLNDEATAARVPTRIERLTTPRLGSVA
jgi:hypothetical protein